MEYGKVQLNIPFVHSCILVRVMKGASPRVIMVFKLRNKDSMLQHDLPRGHVLLSN